MAGEVPNPPLAPKIELMLTTLACADAFNTSAAALVPRKTLVCVIAMVRSYCSSEVVSITSTSPTPALFTRMSSPPNSVRTASIAAVQSASLVTSRRR
jgi:hypothetical protein